MASQTPHDALFKRVFSQPVQAASLLRFELPPAVSARIDWSSLKVVPGSFIDETLGERHTDLLFSAQLGDQSLLIYLLLEHQSHPDALMPFRMLRYVVRIWDRWLYEHHDAKHLPAVVPVVLHHGGKPWSVPSELLGLVSLDATLRTALEPHLPKLRFVLDDLATETDDALGHRALEVLAELSLRALSRLPRSPDPIADLHRWLPRLQKMLTASSGLQRLRVILEYLHCVTDAELTELRKVVAKLGPDAEEVLVTTAQKLIDQGREEGRAEGKAEGRAEGKAEGRAEGQLDLVLRLLELRFGPLSPEHEARARAGTPADLALWAERVLGATRLDEVFDAPAAGSPGPR